MKKTTLFTTLALVVIVAIALSTATFAWYQSVASRTTEDVNLTASSASADLVITQQPAESIASVPNAILANGIANNQITAASLGNWDGENKGTAVSGNSTSFSITNNSASTKATVSVTCTIDNGLPTSNWCVAVKSGEGPYTLIQGPASVDNESAGGKASATITAGTYSFELDASGTATIDILIWIDGPTAATTNAGKTATINFTVTAA